ncbi:hypothetical protein FACS1894109_21780 [Spirochaetia bacterium]|nr:hypothetical protein FACS1894109_21780 [Spirochaetia bacterium]
MSIGDITALLQGGIREVLLLAAHVHKELDVLSPGFAPHLAEHKDL